MDGTLLVVGAPSEVQVHEFLKDDPYVRHGLFASTLVLHWQWSLGNPHDQPMDAPITTPGA